MIAVMGKGVWGGLQERTILREALLFFSGGCLNYSETFQKGRKDCEGAFLSFFSFVHLLLTKKPVKYS